MQCMHPAMNLLKSCSLPSSSFSLQTTRGNGIWMVKETASSICSLVFEKRMSLELTSIWWSPIISSTNSATGLSALFGTRAAKTGGSKPAQNQAMNYTKPPFSLNCSSALLPNKIQSQFSQNVSASNFKKRWQPWTADRLILRLFRYMPSSHSSLVEFAIFPFGHTKVTFNFLKWQFSSQNLHLM